MPAMDKLLDKSSRRLLVTAAVATLALSAAVGLGWPLGIPGEWDWGRSRLAVNLLPAGAAGLVFLALSAYLCRPGRWEALRRPARAAGLALMVVTVFLLQVSLINAVGAPWVGPGAIVASPNATTYFSVSLDVRDPQQWLASYPQLMSSLPYHARTHPPGFVLLFVWLRHAIAALLPEPGETLSAAAEDYSRTFGLGLSPTDAGAAIAGAFIIALSGALSLLPLYGLARRFMEAEPAICAVAVMGVMPGLLLLSASPDLTILALAVAILWLSYAAWRARGTIAAFSAGLALAAGLFLSLGLAVLILWMGIWVCFGTCTGERRSDVLKRLMVALIAGGAGVAAFYLLLYIGAGYRGLAVARESLLAHRSVTTVEVTRTYWKWVVMNPVEAAVFAGVPLTVTAVWSLFGGLRDERYLRLRRFLLAWLITVALLDLSGTVRGEVGRIWLFLLWPASLAAGTWLAGRRNRSFVLAALVLLQVWQALLMRGYLTLYSIL